MKPIITIPSYCRPNSKIFTKLENIPLDKYIFIRKEQYPEYSYLEQKGFHLIKLPSGITELGMTRRYLVYWCYKHGYDWAFMFDDDTSHVECLEPVSAKEWKSKRILHEPDESPRFETAALKKWFIYAKKYSISLSSPNHRAYDRTYHGNLIRVNKSVVPGCALLYVPDIIAVGNYENTLKVGAEDYYIQYKLMSAGYKAAKMGFIEFNTPTCGNILDGTNDTFEEKTERWVRSFLENVCNDPKYIRVKTTKTGHHSIGFVWKSWNGYIINLEEE